MDKIAKQCGIAIPPEDPDLKVYQFPTDEGDSFLDWSGLCTDPDARDASGVLNYVDFRTGAPIDYYDMEDTIHDQMYEGHRDILEPMLRRDWERLHSVHRRHADAGTEGRESLLFGVPNVGERLWDDRDPENADPGKGTVLRNIVHGARRLVQGRRVRWYLRSCAR